MLPSVHSLQLTALCAPCADTCTIEAGLFEGVTLGSTIMVRVPNKDQRSGDYSEMAVAYRRAASTAEPFRWMPRSCKARAMCLECAPCPRTASEFATGVL